MQNNQGSINKLFEEHPYFATKFEPQFSSEDLEKIGVSVPGMESLPNGYIKLYPEDFIVEEVTPQKKICTIEETPSWEISDNPQARFIHATIVKKGIATLEALMELARNLGIYHNRIIRGGLKDAVAITSQRVSFEGVEKEKLEGLRVGTIFLKDVSYERYPMHIGNLYGNRFTIMVRSQESIEEKDFTERLKKLETEGFPNFYSTQRFGRRLGAHVIGKKILQGDFEGALKEFLANTSPYEMPYISMIRVQVQDNWRDWAKIYTLYQKLPMYFVHELRFLKSLREEPNDFVYSLRRNSDLTKLYYDAYVSYVFNKTLTNLINKGERLPKVFPFFGDSKEALEVYGPVLKSEGIDQTKLRVTEMPFIQLRRGTVPVVIFPEKVKYKVLTEGVVLSFVLPKGAYATTFLSMLFNLREGDPIPIWVKEDQRNLKEEIGELEKELSETKNQDVAEDA
ncbi:MAG: hypothetical protein A3J50_03590 [Candidatus Woykebacteria bacterium RIFCSPHIGHO2_02_FULL_43_16b]|uniref:TRUD domain-containing protein n=1 Tax=Candidatus Woykebacteria bacterium RIFCSPHIGHO2_02_FULL_43_16b TaxID=1802601 RepID=A0A1G1WMA8_9BACT|nr:MAG: hypothetical protein A3J50_03590 [Candidatus Woykebacteria bacterium RIFCSPHIGHO2_02_FULL_43_16b]